MPKKKPYRSHHPIVRHQTTDASSVVPAPPTRIPLQTLVKLRGHVDPARWKNFVGTICRIVGYGSYFPYLIANPHGQTTYVHADEIEIVP